MENVMVAVDGSADAERALKMAVEIAKGTGASLTLVTVFDADYGSLVDYTLTARERTSSAMQEAKKMVEDMGAAIEGVRAVDTMLETGHAADVLCKVAAERKPTLLVMGNRGMRRLERFLLGSVSERVVKYATVPVLVVR